MHGLAQVIDFGNRIAAPQSAKERPSKAETKAVVLPLFAYGTLRDPEYQRELFARTYPMQLARVTGFRVVSTGGGYLAAIRQDGAAIDGELVYLDDAGYAVADAWEDRSVYDRIEIEAHRGDGRIERCYIYVQFDARGAPVSDDRLADRARADVIADIRRFRAAAGFRPPR